MRIILLLYCLTICANFVSAATVRVATDLTVGSPQPSTALRAAVRSAIASSPSSSLLKIAEAVQAAREGHFNTALTHLYAHLQRYRYDSKAYAETLVVLEWAKRYEEAAILALGRPDLALPLYALRSAARSARRAGLLDDAETLIARGLNLAPTDPGLISLRIHLLGDRGEIAKGLQLAKDALQTSPENADLWLGKYFLHLLAGETLAALDAVERANDLKPSAYARRELIYSLERTGMQGRALALVDETPDVVSEDERFRLKRAVNAHRIRWGSYSQPLEQHYAETDAALLELDELQSDLQTGDYQQMLLHQKVLLFNRLVALRDRRYMAQVIDLWQILLQQGIEVPDYALQAVADALLSLRRPEESALIYAEILRREKTNFSAQVGLYYSLHEANRYTRATELIEQLAGKRLAGSFEVAMPKDRHDQLTAAVINALDKLYRNEPDQAENLFEPIFNSAPHNRWLRQVYGEIQNARQHPRRAQRLFEQGLAVEPQHYGLQVALTDSFLVRRQWRLAEQSLARHRLLFPDEGGTLRLQDEWERHNLREVEGRAGVSLGQSPTVDGRELSWLLRGWTRPVDYDWRVGVHQGSRWAHLPEGDAGRSEIGVDWQRLSPNLSLSGRLGMADSSSERIVAEFSGRYEFDDQWALSASASRNTEVVALRALNAGIGATEFHLSAGWKRHEALSAGVSAAWLDYDDDNRRLSLAGSVRQRFRTGPRLMLDRILRVSGSTNSRPGGPYYAPESDLTLEAELQAQWQTWRWYEESFTQRASVSGGSYWQEGYGWSLPVAASYSHEWELRKRRLFIEYGPSASLRQYDGVAETNFGFSLAFSWRY